MIIGVGVDLVEVDRLRLSRHGERLLNRLFTLAERADCGTGPSRWPSLAARFAAKEAVLKALGTGLRGMTWQDIEIRRDALGKPVTHLRGGAQARARAIGVGQVLVSLSHTREQAIAQAVAVQEEGETL